MLNENVMAPDFKLHDQDGVLRLLHEFKGKWLLLYFYPKDDTPGCTKEACNFRDSYHQLIALGVNVVGVSKDSVVSHKKFAIKYNLSFPLLSDPDLGMIKAYEAWGEKKFMGRVFNGVHRVSYLIDPEGKIKKAYAKVNPLTHTNEIMDDFKSFSLES